MSSIISRRSLLKTALITPVIASQIGCSFESKKPLKVCAHIWPGYEILFMAKDMDKINPEVVQLIPTENASSSMQALRDGKVQGAMITLDEAMRLSSEGIGLKVVLIFNTSSGADALVARKSIQSLAELKGKTLGYEQTALGALMLSAILEASQLDIKDLNLRHITADRHKASWDAKQIDALITFEPVKTNILKNKNSHVLFDSSEIPDTIYDVLVVTNEAAKKQPKAIKSLVEAHFLALNHFRINPMDASNRIAKRLNSSTEDILKYYQGLFMPDALTNYAMLSHEDLRLTQASKNLKEIMLSHDLVRHDCEFHCSFSNKFIPRKFL